MLSIQGSSKNNLAVMCPPKIFQVLLAILDFENENVIGSGEKDFISSFCFHFPLLPRVFTNLKVMSIISI